MPEPDSKPDAKEPAPDRRTGWIVLGCGLLYGGAARLMFGLDALERWLGGAATMVFIWLVPFAMGSLVAFLGMSLTSNESVSYWGVGMPALTVLVGVIVSLVTGFEAAFCVLVAAPILFPLVILGGVIAALVVKKTGQGRTYVTAAVLLPYAAAPIEQAIALPEEILSIENRIVIQASPERVWEEIASVPAISRDELRGSWIHTLGFPRPIAAVLEGEGVGAVRVATFEREVSFFEVVTEWRPAETIAFSIEADPQFVPANAFDEHVIIGGRFYDVLDGRYRIEDRGDGSVVLHLSSRHRLNTHLGRYASWWSGQVMGEIQGNILHVIRQRAERDGRSTMNY